MALHTAAEGVTFAKKLEEDSAGYYEELVKKYGKDSDTLLAYAKENRKNIATIDRTYYGVITDALEGGYAFNLEPEPYVLDVALKDGDYKDAIAQAVKIEETIVAFYDIAAEQSGALMADVPRAFMLIAKKRAARIEKLKSL